MITMSKLMKRQSNGGIHTQQHHHTRITDAATTTTTTKMTDNPLRDKTLPLNLQLPSATRVVHMFVYIKAVTDIDCKNQEFHVQYHQYLQWAPTAEEYTNFINDNSYRPDFLPKYLPTNAKAVDSEEEELRHGDSNSLHLLSSGSVDVWGEEIAYNSKNGDSFAFFGISRKFSCTISRYYHHYHHHHE